MCWPQAAEAAAPTRPGPLGGIDDTLKNTFIPVLKPNWNQNYFTNLHNLSRRDQQNTFE
jgi:hypothetical protein